MTNDFTKANLHASYLHHAPYPTSLVEAIRIIDTLPAGPAASITCSWTSLSDQILQQWTCISRVELESVGPNRHNIAELISRKYGIACNLIENYLRNFERTMPLPA